MSIIEVGYVIVSKQISVDKRPVGYFYREAPDNSKDSGWRFFSGDEDQSYADKAANFDIFNASTIIEISPNIRTLLGTDYPATFELIHNKFVNIPNELPRAKSFRFASNSQYEERYLIELTSKDFTPQEAGN